MKNNIISAKKKVIVSKKTTANTQPKTKKTERSSLKTCKKCTHGVSPSARLCPNCGHPMGFISWLTENQFLILITSVIGFITSIVGINGVDDFKSWFGLGDEQTNVQVHEGNNSNTTINNQPIVQPNIDVPPPSKKKCTVCNGSRKAPCPVCKHYKGYLPCHTCNGSGKQVCPKCKGTRGTFGQTITYCDQCRGAGTISCPACPSRPGFQKCYSCSDGYVHCMSCPN